MLDIPRWTGNVTAELRIRENLQAGSCYAEATRNNLMDVGDDGA
jgi:hypothetical protein